MEMMHSGVCGLRSSCLRFPYLQEQPIFRSARSAYCSFSFSRRMLTTTSANTNKDKNEKVVVISGPTGAGKSRLALELAKHLNGEIISADSVQIYQGLDIGSAKPSTDDRKEVPHHLIDILHPSQDYSVGQFFEDARQATRNILDKGRVPIVTGGTGLYLRWFIYGKPDVPKASPEITSKVSLELDDLQRNEDWDAAVQLVANAGDPKAQLLATNDWYRLRRSLEIIKSSGSPPSAFQVPYDSFKEQIGSITLNPQEANSSVHALEETISKELEYDFICFFLSSQRLDLYRSIDYRCEDMLSGQDGILSEAQWLLDGGLLPNSNSATRAIGYRQAMEYLLFCRQNGGRSSEREFYYFLSEFQKVSRNFAKRQLTWFRNEQIYHWLDASKPMDKVLKFINDAYHDQSGTLTVPEALRMKKDISNQREASALKSYRPQNSSDTTKRLYPSSLLERLSDVRTVVHVDAEAEVLKFPSANWLLQNSQVAMKAIPCRATVSPLHECSSFSHTFSFRVCPLEENSYFSVTPVNLRMKFVVVYLNMGHPHLCHTFMWIPHQSGRKRCT